MEIETARFLGSWNCFQSRSSRNLRIRAIVSCIPAPEVGPWGEFARTAMVEDARRNYDPGPELSRNRVDCAPRCFRSAALSQSFSKLSFGLASGFRLAPHQGNAMSFSTLGLDSSL